MPFLSSLPALLLAAAELTHAATQVEVVSVRARDQKVHLYGPPDGSPAVVTSGDGGWLHLGPQVAEFLASRGYRVVGVDAKAYLSSFTAGTKTLEPADVPGDFRVFVDLARQGGPRRVLLVGVSEGAGLSMLAASDPVLQASLEGVVALGLPDRNELAWRFRDSVIYLTHRTPQEPFFSAADYIPRLLSTPIAALHSTHDEFVPLDEVRGMMVLPGGPKRLWIIEAADHRFSDNQAELRRRMLEAIEWIRSCPR